MRAAEAGQNGMVTMTPCNKTRQLADHFPYNDNEEMGLHDHYARQMSSFGCSNIR